MTDPHSYYCAECRATFDFHHLPGCTCSRVQQFVVQHRESHDKYPDNANPHTTLRTHIIAAIAKADQDWCSDNLLYDDMADAVIRELGLNGVKISEVTDAR